MNYDRARQRVGLGDDKPLGLWDWTTYNGRFGTRVAKPCTASCHHTTREEAERHFYEFCLASVKPFNDTEVQHKCGVCGAWTSRGFRNERLSMLKLESYLCKEHQTIAALEKLHPFKPDLEVIYS